jgi:tetrapyrrole methylase family protein/MazG family protein
MNKKYTFQNLIEIVEALRGPEGCPWDKVQTHESLIRWAIEESHELAEAIHSNDTSEIKGELGDLLLQVVLHSVISRQNKSFSIEDVIQDISEKMIRRHPHVFSNEKADLDEVYQNWEKIKAEEKKNKKKKTQTENFGISKTLPALLVSQKIGEKTKAQNFDWSTPKEVKEKVFEELNEFQEAIENKDKKNMEEEYGDLLFSLTQLGRHLNIEAEQALFKANKKFETRYFKMKSLIENEGGNFNELTQLEKDKYWKQVKADELI